MRPVEVEVDPATVCRPPDEPVPALEGEVPSPYPVQLPVCGQALGPIEVEGFERSRLVDPLDVGLVGVPVGAQARVELAFTNESDRPQTFSAGWVGPSPFELEAPALTLGPGESTAWLLSWTPRAVGRVQAELEVRRGDSTERILVDGASVETMALRCRIELPERISREAALPVALLCRNQSSVPVEARLTGLTKRDSAFAFELRLRNPGTEAVLVPPLGMARWPLELCPRMTGPIGITAQVEASTPAGSVTVAVFGASSHILGPSLEVSESPILRPQPGSPPLPVSFVLRNTGLEPVDLLAADTPTELRWVRSLKRRIEPDDQVEARLEYVGTSSVARTFRVGLQTSVGPRDLTVHVEPEVLEAGTDCIPDLVGLPEDVDLGELGEWPLTLASNNGIPERLGSFSLQNRGPSRCRFGLRGRGDVELELDLDLAPGERALIPLNIVIEPGDCFIQGAMELYDRDDWRLPRSFDVRARLIRDGPKFSLRQATAGPSCPWPTELPSLSVRSREVIDVAALDGLVPADAELGFEPSDCERLNGAIEVRSPSGRRARVPVGLRPSAACGDELPFEPRVQVDDFEMLGPLKVDVVWILDDTASMGPLWPKLGEDFDAYYQFIDAKALDARIFIHFMEGGWVRDDFGAPRAFDLSPGNTRGDFLEALAEPDFRGGYETTLDVAVQAAISVPLRPEARLELIALSNEPDLSSIGVDAALNRLLSIKGLRNTQLFSFDAISGGDSGCTFDDGESARPAPRLVELANRTGGVNASICTRGWSRTLQDLSRTWGFRNRFFLTNQPLIETIEVRVDDVALPDQAASGQFNWTYDFSTNAVAFTPLAVPRPGSQVQIRYQAECL